MGVQLHNHHRHESVSLDDLEWGPEDTGVTSTSDCISTPASLSALGQDNVLDSEDEDEDWDQEFGLDLVRTNANAGALFSGTSTDTTGDPQSEEDFKIPANQLLRLSDESIKGGESVGPYHGYSIIGPDGSTSCLLTDGNEAALWLTKVIDDQSKNSDQLEYKGLTAGEATMLAQERLAAATEEAGLSKVVWAKAHLIYITRMHCYVSSAATFTEAQKFIEQLPSLTFTNASERRDVCNIALQVLSLAGRMWKEPIDSIGYSGRFQDMLKTLVELEPELGPATELLEWEVRAHYYFSNTVAKGQSVFDLSGSLWKLYNQKTEYPCDVGSGHWTKACVQAASLADIHLLQHNMSPLTMTPPDVVHTRMAEGKSTSLMEYNDDNDNELNKVLSNTYHRMHTLLLPRYQQLPSSSPAKCKVGLTLAMYMWDARIDFNTSQRILLEVLWLLIGQGGLGLNCAIGAKALQLYGEVLLLRGQLKTAWVALEGSLAMYTLMENHAEMWQLRRRLAVVGIRVDWCQSVRYYAMIFVNMMEEGKVNETIHVSLLVSDILTDHGEHRTAENFLIRTLGLINTPQHNKQERRERTDPLVLSLQTKLAQVFISGQRIDEGIQLLEEMLTTGVPGNKRFLLQLQLADAFLRRRWLDEAQEKLNSLSMPRAIASRANHEGMTAKAHIENTWTNPRLQMNNCSPQAVKSFRYWYLVAKSHLLSTAYQKALSASDKAMDYCDKASLSSQALACRLKSKVFQALVQSCSSQDFPVVLKEKAPSNMPGTLIEEESRAYWSTMELIGGCVCYLRKAHDLFRAVGDEVRAAKTLAAIASVQLSCIFTSVALLGRPLADCASAELLSDIEVPATLSLEVAVEGCLWMTLLIGYLNLAEIAYLRHQHHVAMCYWLECKNRFYEILVPGCSVAVNQSWGPSTVKKILGISKRMLLLLLCWDGHVINRNLMMFDIYLQLQQRYAMWSKDIIDGQDSRAVVPPSRLSSLSRTSSSLNLTNHSPAKQELEAKQGLEKSNEILTLVRSMPDVLIFDQPESTYENTLPTIISRHASKQYRSPSGSPMSTLRYSGDFRRNRSESSLVVSNQSSLKFMTKLDHIFATQKGHHRSKMGNTPAKDSGSSGENSLNMSDTNCVTARIWADMCCMKSQTNLCAKGEVPLAALRQHNVECLRKTKRLVSLIRKHDAGNFKLFYTPPNENEEEKNAINDNEDNTENKEEDQSQNVDGYQPISIEELCAKHPLLYRISYVLSVDDLLITYVPFTTAKKIIRVKGRERTSTGSDRTPSRDVFNANVVSYLTSYLDDGPAAQTNQALGSQGVSSQDKEKRFKALSDLKNALSEILSLIGKPSKSVDGTDSFHMRPRMQPKTLRLPSIFNLFGTNPTANDTLHEPVSTNTDTVPLIVVAGTNQQALPWDLLLSEPVNRALNVSSLLRQKSLPTPSPVRRSHDRLQEHAIMPQVFSFYYGTDRTSTLNRQQQQHQRLQYTRQYYTASLCNDPRKHALTSSITALSQPYQPLVRFGKKLTGYKRTYKEVTFLDCAEMGPKPEKFVERIEECLDGGKYPTLLLTFADLIDPSWSLLSLMQDPTSNCTLIFLPKSQYKKAVGILSKFINMYLKNARHSAQGPNAWVLNPCQFLTAAVGKIRKDLGQSVVVFNWPRTHLTTASCRSLHI